MAEKKKKASALKKMEGLLRHGKVGVIELWIDGDTFHAHLVVDDEESEVYTGSGENLKDAFKRARRQMKLAKGK